MAATGALSSVPACSSASHRFGPFLQANGGLGCGACCSRVPVQNRTYRVRSCTSWLYRNETWADLLG